MLLLTLFVTGYALEQDREFYEKNGKNDNTEMSLCYSCF